MRDITLEDTVYFVFTTRAFATGIPTVLAGTPALSVLESNNVTPITAGVSVQVDRASVVGLNQATVVATAANGYEVGKSYGVYISTGTVGGVSVVGEVVAEFTVQASAAAVDLANGTDGLGAIKTDTAAILVDTGTTLDARIPAALVSGRMDASVGAMAADTLTASALATDAVTEIQAGLATPTNITAGTITTVTNLTTNNDKTGYTLTATTGLGNQTADLTGNLSGSVGSVTGAVGSVAAGGIAAASFAAGAIDAAAIAANAIGASELAADAVAEIADGLLDRDMATGTDSGSASVRTVRQALRFLRNKWTLVGTVLTVTKEDDATTSWAATVTTDAAADPITASDPAGP